MAINRKIKQLCTVVLGLVLFSSCKESVDYVNPTWARAVLPADGATVKIDFFEPDETQIFRWEARSDASYKIYFDIDMHFQNPYIVDMGSKDSIRIKNSELLEILREVYPSFSSIKRFFWKVEQNTGGEIKSTWRYFNAILSVESFVDCRDGEKYEARQFVLEDGSLMTIMAENLRAKAYTDGSALPIPYMAAIHADPSFVAKAGGYYTWVTAINMSWDEAKAATLNDTPVQGVCPCGWHLPSYKEIDALRNHLGIYTGANSIKDPSYWKTVDNVTNDTKMDIIASGFYWRENMTFLTDPLGVAGNALTGFWTSTPYLKGLALAWGETALDDNKDKAVSMLLYDDVEGIYLQGYGIVPGVENRGYPVRCIMDKVE